MAQRIETMKLLCRLFGHAPIPDHWRNTPPYPGGVTYLKMYPSIAIDGVKRVHVDLEAKCPRCGVRRTYYKTHIPTAVIDQLISAKTNGEI